MPRFDIPISYVSGKQKANLAFILLLSFIICPYSPPEYLPGFETDLSIVLIALFIFVFLNDYPVFLLKNSLCSGSRARLL